MTGTVRITKRDLKGWRAIHRATGLTSMPQDRDFIVELGKGVTLNEVPSVVQHAVGHLHDADGKCLKRRAGRRCDEKPTIKVGDVVKTSKTPTGNRFGWVFRGVVTTPDDPIFRALGVKPAVHPADTANRHLVVFPNFGQWEWYAPEDLTLVTEEMGG